MDHVDVGNKQLLLYCASARHKHSAYLEDQKKYRSKIVAGEKRKALSNEVNELKVKRKALHRLILRLCLLQLMNLQIKKRNCRNCHFWQKQMACDEQQDRKQTN